ncbi:MAG: AAA family ATPase [Kofleriaceae bacterium]
MTTTLTRIELAGFRSIASMDLQLGRTTVLIGPNGAGKSNLLTFLRMVPRLRTQSLRTFVGYAGGADALLHHGAKRTPVLRFRIEATDGNGNDTAYAATLGAAAGDALIFLDERVEARDTRQGPLFTGRSLGAGHVESQLEPSSKNTGLWPASAVRAWVMRMNFFHFHDTSTSAPLRNHGNQAESDYLRWDGRNLAPYLYRLANSDAEADAAAFRRITSLVQRIAPFVKTLEPTLVAPERGDASAVKLDWTDVNDSRFGVHQLSDGTLRSIALFTALAQPVANLPGFIAIDEPELGLHPAALALFAGLVRSVAPYSQVIVSTQSPALLDEFPPEDVVVVAAPRGASTFQHLDPNQLAAWLDEYTLSEVWDKNLIGGRP